MDMTTVLPLPVAILQGRAGTRLKAGVMQRLKQVLLDPVLAVLGLLGHLGDEDEGFERLDLAEEQPSFAFGVGPVVKQRAGDGGHVGPAAVPPELDDASGPC